MKERTGKTIAEWVELVRQTLPAEQKGRLKWLKERYGLGQSSAYIILDRVERDAGDAGLPMRTPDLIDAQFTGENAGLRPLYDWLAGRLQALGGDVKERPCKTYVPFYRNKVFVYVKPVKGKLHMALGLPEGADERLEPVGRLGGPERIKVKAVATTQAEIEDLWALVRMAYDTN
jgi:predicted transport protein